MKREIADRLYTFRKNSGLSQEELAEKIGVSRQAVSKWERGEASPDTENLILLAKTYGVSLDELILSREEPKKTQKNSGARQDETPEKTAGEENRDTEKDSAGRQKIRKIPFRFKTESTSMQKTATKSILTARASMLKITTAKKSM